MACERDVMTVPSKQLYDPDPVYDGSLDALISQNPYGLGYNSVTAAIEAIDGKTDFPDVTESAYWLVDADNIHNPEVIKILDPLGTLNLK